MDLRLTGKVALITGVSRGIGLAAAANGLRATGSEVLPVPADMTKPEEAENLIAANVATFGGIDILINNVGGGGGSARIEGGGDDDWRAVLDTNVLQTVRMMRLALPHMKGRPGAAVVNIASIFGWTPQLAMAGQYDAAKAALIFAIERGALEFVPHGIRVALSYEFPNRR